MIEVARRQHDSGGTLESGGAHAPAGGVRRNLSITFEKLSMPTAPRLQSARSTLKFVDLLQAVIDVGALVFIALFLAIAAAAIPVALFILFYVRLA